MQAYMRHRKLPPETTRRVLNYLDYAWASNKGIDEREVLSGLPQSLQEEVQVSAHWQMIAQV
jgi:predicted metal-dependent hydrolase